MFTPPPPPTPIPETVPHTIRCLNCRYDLVGLATNGLCPECARPIIDTVNATIGVNSEQLAALDRHLRLARWATVVLGAALPLALLCDLLLTGFTPTWLAAAFVIALVFLAVALLWFMSWATICATLNTQDLLDGSVNAGQRLSVLLFALTLTSPVSLTALAFCISTAYGTIPALFVLALCLLHRFLICRRVHSLADFVLDTRQSSHLLAMSTLLNVFGFLHAGGLGYLVVSPPAQDWVLWVAVFWFPPFALIFWIVVLTRLRRCTSAMLGAHGTA